jgi:phosphoglycerol transferase MdoB-like AlkP superfamily enzyme
VFKFDEVARSTRVSILFILVGFLGVVWGVGSSIASQRIVGAFLASLAFIVNLVCIFRFWKRYNLFIISLLRESWRVPRERFGLLSGVYEISREGSMVLSQIF